jgi:ferredoxin
MMRIAIIGSGLSAWAVYETLQSRKFPSDSITIIDANGRYSGKHDFTSSGGLKTKFGSTFAYDTKGSGLEFREQSNFSMAHGGLSNTWGAGIRLWDKESLQNFHIDCGQIYKAAEMLLSKIPFFGDAKSLNFPKSFNSNSEVRPRGSGAFDRLILEANLDSSCRVSTSALAVNVNGSNACVGCGNCLSGCPYGAIFETSSLFDRQFIRSSFEFIEAIVSHIEASTSGAKVVYRNEQNELQSSNFDRVFLCTGAIGTPSILMRSKLIPSKIMVPDSQVFYFFGFGYFNRKNRNEQFALAQANIASIPGDDPEFMASLYVCNSDVRSRISQLIASNFFGLRIRIPKFIDRFLFLGIGFIDSTKSGHLLLELGSDKEEIKVTPERNLNSRKAIRKALRRIARQTKKSKMYVFSWMYQMPNPGAGFHSGASTPAGGEFVSSTGALRSLESVRIADVSILPFVKPGPHTFTSMALNSALVSENLT